MNREVHVRFWEGLGVRFPRATQLGACRSRDPIEQHRYEAWSFLQAARWMTSL